MNQPDSITPTPVVDYAAAERRAEPFSIFEYVFGLIATALFIGLLYVPFYLLGDMKRLYEDFKLKLSPSTMLMGDIRHSMVETYAYYWMWLIPPLLPLVLRRVPRRVRERGMLLLVLIAALISVFLSHAINEPIVNLVGGLK